MFSRRAPLRIALAAALLLTAGAATAQVEVSTLAAPDYFSLGERDAGLGSDVWLRTSPAVAREVIPQVGRKPMSPAATDLAKRVLGAGATGPEGAGRDPDMAAARIQALLRLGSPAAAWLAAERAPAATTNINLAEAVAESALIAGQEETACRISEQLAVGRGELYWLRLRAFCQARAGLTDAAQLTLTLAGEKARDPVFARLMGALIAGAGDPGAASLRNGLELALSRRLALDLETARPTASPAIAQTLWPTPGGYDTEAAATARSTFVASRGAAGIVDGLIAEAEAAPPKSQPVLFGRILLLQAMGGQLSPDARGRMARADVGRSTASPARLFALEIASAFGLKGETALLVLAVAGEAGAGGPPAADRARIILALRRVGLNDAAESFAIEGLLAAVK